MRADFKPIKVPAGESVEFTAPGVFWRLFDTTGPLRVQLPDLDWDLKSVPGGIGFPTEGPFTNVRLINEGAGEVTGRFFHASEHVEANRIEGQVTVSGTVVTETVKARQYPLYSQLRGFAAGSNHGAVVFRNPAGSGTEVFLHSLFVDCGSAFEFYVTVQRITAASVTLVPANYAMGENPARQKTPSVLVAGQWTGSDKYESVNTLVDKRALLHTYGEVSPIKLGWAGANIIYPGQELSVFSANLGGNATATLHWEERPEA